MGEVDDNVILKLKMSVIRELSHHKRNVVLELFGTSKKHVSKENLQSPVNRPSKKFHYQSGAASKLFSLLQETPMKFKSSKKNNESIMNESISRKVH